MRRDEVIEDNRSGVINLIRQITAKELCGKHHTGEHSLRELLTTDGAINEKHNQRQPHQAAEPAKPRNMQQRVR